MVNYFQPINIQYYLNQLNNKGKLVYEYNPFRVLRLSENRDSQGKRPGESGYNPDDEDLLEAGAIVDLDTKLLNFDLNHPVNLLCQNSYDGSVNVILNDGKNIPRLINSRFSSLQNNTYEVVDRLGSNDTNLYDEDQFDNDSSLYKRINQIPVIEYNGQSGGNLLVGNYVFYIKYADADDNETDFVAESGIVSCYIGTESDPYSINGGFRDMNAYKSISLTVRDVDPSYDYIRVYFTRTTSDLNQSRIVKAYKINNKFKYRGSSCNILITGDEDKVEIPISDINIQYFLADKVKCQAQCQNMLFLGNINKPTENYREFSDLSLRILPYLHSENKEVLIGNLDSNYTELTTYSGYEYYNTQNIYNRVGYWDEEIYRFGIVYVLNDGSLSSVYNVRGINKIPTLENLFNTYSSVNFDVRNESNLRQYIEVDQESYLLANKNQLENSKGVIRMVNPGDYINSIGFFIPEEVLNELRTLQVSGFFIVRQKRIPTILCQGLLMPMEDISNLPVIKADTPFIERFLDNNRVLVQDFKSRKIEVKNLSQRNYAVICPDYELDQAYFNQLFTGITFPIKYSSVQSNIKDLKNTPYNERSFYLEAQDITASDSTMYDVKIIAVNDNTPIVQVEDSKFRGRAGEAEDGSKFRYVNNVNETKDASNIVRGVYYPYLGLTSNQLLEHNNIINIYIPGYNPNKISDYFKIRYEDNSAYYTISDRYTINNTSQKFQGISLNGYFGFYKDFYRGDCFISNFTHRLNRNFQDPDAPINDQIVDPNTWKDNYELENKENLQKINRGDVNAIELGAWITFKVRSSNNISIRSEDESNVSEQSLTGVSRGYFPLQEMSTAGNYKIPNSYALNKGFSATVSEKLQFSLPEVPYVKNTFDNRIVYSDIAVNDAFKNGYRVFQFNHYKDYPRVYGGLVKLIELQGSLLAVWEHGVGIIPVNERAVAGEGAGGNVFINTSNVLPENPKMLSDMYGSQWAESVLKTPYYVYGVDTVGKKIWRTNGSQFEIISDFKIQKFLNDNISLTERELEPIVGVRNVKTHYNAFKSDVMFTFYDNTIGFEEKVWNLCYNEVLQNWITFYSWVPSYSENIDNIYFSFDRNTSKWISKLAVSSYNNPSASGVVLEKTSLPTIEDWYEGVNLYVVDRELLPKDNKTLNRYLEENIIFTLERDCYGNYKKFEIVGNKLRLKRGEQILTDRPIELLNISYINQINLKSETNVPDNIIEYVNGWKDYQSFNSALYQCTIALTIDSILNATAKDPLNLTTDFWKHGQSGIIDIKDKIKPCFWYGKQHPFEFEFIVVDNPAVHKIFNNLQIISNKAKPESFHYEIVGECFDFVKDKKNLFIRQEATRDFYQYNGSDITYDRKFLELQGEQNKKSITMPNYYSRVDTINEIEDSYKQATSPNKDYNNLSGSEIVYYDNLNEFRIWNHSKAVDIEEEGGRIRGNMNYQEDKWDVQINPIIIVEKNESQWNSHNGVSKVPITIGNSPIPEDFIGTQVTNDNIPDDLKDKGYTIQDIDVSDWGVYPIGRDLDGNLIYADAGTRKEVKVKDKFVKIRIRYSGEDIAIITALKTIYNISYA